MIVYKTTDDNYEQYEDYVDASCDDVIDGCELDEFGVKKSELFLTVVNNHCYRPGVKEKYGVRKGKVYSVDDLNIPETVSVMDISKKDFLKKMKKIFG